MKFTVICAVYGNLPVVKECMDSWFPLPPNWNLVVYNSRISDLDGTTEYLKQKQLEQGFVILEDSLTRTHTSAIRKLLSHVDGDWILHLDSDAKLVNRHFFDWITATKPQRAKYKVWGRVTDRISSKIENRPECKNMMYLPRCHQWLLMFEKKYLLRNKISFDDVIINGTLATSNGNMISDDGVITYKVGDSIRIFGDTSWQLFWESIGDDAFISFPEEGYNCWQHLNNKSCEWERENINIIKNAGIKKTNSG